MSNKNEEVVKESLFSKVVNVALYILFGIALVLLVLKLFFFGYYNVNGESMMPTFEDGEKIIASLVHKSTELKTDDVLIIDTDEVFIIKRLIGLPGDTVEIKEGKVYVNGKERTNEADTRVYIDENLTVETELKVTLKDDEYFVLGDNRGNSKDSRHYGLFSKEDIKAVYDREMKKQ